MRNFVQSQGRQKFQTQEPVERGNGHHDDFFKLDTSREVVCGHARLVDAIEAGDREEACRLLEDHVVEVRERLKAISEKRHC